MPQSSTMSFRSVSQSLGDTFFCVSSFVLILIIWRNPILIKFVLFSPFFLILLVADPSFPLYLIVSCGKFLEFSGFFCGCKGVKNILTFPKG